MLARSVLWTQPGATHNTVDFDGSIRLGGVGFPDYTRQRRLVGPPAIAYPSGVKRVLFVMLLSLAAIYLGIVALFAANQRKLLYFWPRAWLGGR